MDCPKCGEKTRAVRTYSIKGRIRSCDRVCLVCKHSYSTITAESTLFGLPNVSGYRLAQMLGDRDLRIDVNEVTNQHLTNDD